MSRARDVANRTVPDSAVTSAKIADGAIVDADINASAAIAATKLASLSSVKVPTLDVNTQTDSYTLVIGDAGKLIEMGKATAQTLTVPANSSVAFPTGTKIDVLQTGAGQVTVAGANGVTVNATPGLKISAQWGAATLIKRATDTWVLVGSLSA